MSTPSPSFFRGLISGATSSVCEKFNKVVVGLSQGVADWVAFEYNENGISLTDEYVTLICAANCAGGGSGGGGTENPNMPTPISVVATDGTYSTKVRITWGAVTPPVGAVSNYFIYRSALAVTSGASSTQIGTVSGDTLSFDDTTAVPGTTYNYYVRATNGTDTSAYGGPDTGFASSASVTFPQTTDLIVTKGFDLATGFIRIMFSVPAGATAFDLYRNTVDDSSTATLVVADKVWEDPTSTVPTLADGLCQGLAGKVIYFHTPPSPSVKYYFWIKSKKDAPPEISAFSNSDNGWVILGSQDAGAGAPAEITVGTIIIPGSGITKMRVILIGGGGAGAGSSSVWGGGSGSGGNVLMALIPVTAGDIYTYATFFAVNASSNFGNPPQFTPTDVQTFYEYEGKAVKLTRQDGKRIQAAGASSGKFVNGGGSTGAGLNNNASLTFVESPIATDELEIVLGESGSGASGNSGGVGGAAFGYSWSCPAHLLGGSNSGNPLESFSGGGGSSAATVKSGGSNSNGRIFYVLIP